MIWLIALPFWVILCGYLFPPDSGNYKKYRAFMILCSLAMIMVLGLRSRYTGTTDTYIYTLAFDNAKHYSDLSDYLAKTNTNDSIFLFSERGFYAFTWLAAHIFPDAQWFLLLTATVIVCCTAYFISRSSEDPLISWIVFICLGSMTFAMNGMRQALAMAICLVAYRFAKERRLLPFLAVVLVAVLFHKSALIFLLVYFLCRLRMNWKSVLLLAIGTVAFFVLADRLALFYDSITGEDYAVGEVFESGGEVNVIIYLIAIIGFLLASRKTKNPQMFEFFALVVLAASLYLGRFYSAQIFERMSYYFSFSLVIGFPLMFRSTKKEDQTLFRIGFIVLGVALYVYRISKGSFSNFEMFW